MNDDFDEDDFEAGFDDYDAPPQGSAKKTVSKAAQQQKMQQMIGRQQNKPVTSAPVKDDGRFQVTAISWSCNGASLAVAYGRMDHSSWCEHQSVISIWSVFRRDYDPKKPHITIETPNCISSIAFHPEEPLILAAGTVNGEILIWNTDFDDTKGEAAKLLRKSDADEYFHREPIQQILWLGLPQENSIRLEIMMLTISTDGKVLIWNRPMATLRYPIKGHLLARPTEDRKGYQSLGGISMSVVKERKTGLELDLKIVIGTEGGQVSRVYIRKPEIDVRDGLREQVHNGRDIQWSDEAYRFLSNIALAKPSDAKSLRDLKEHIDLYMIEMKAMQVFADHIFKSKPDLKRLYPPFGARQMNTYEKHHVPVLATASSPFLPRLFLTGSADGTVRMYDQQDKRPVASFEPAFGEYVMDVAFSQERPSVFAAISSSGNLFLYDLVANKQCPSEIIRYETLEEDGSAVTVPSIFRQAQRIEFNPRQRSLVAVGYLDGFVRVFKLKASLCNKHPDDFKVLKSFIQSEEERKE